MIQWELCKNLKFDYTTQWYKRKQESIQGNKNKKFFPTLRYKRISRKSERVLINMKKITCHLWVQPFREN